MNNPRRLLHFFYPSWYLMILSLLPLTGLAQDNPFTPFHAEYIVRHDGEEIAMAQLSLTRINENRWLYQSHSEPTGWLARITGTTIQEKSEWQWRQGIEVINYRYDRSGKKKQVHLLFDWQNMKVTNIINGEPWHMKIEHGTLDKLSINLALRAHLIRTRSSTSFPVADGGTLKIYDFTLAGEESITTPLGNIHTIKILRNKRGRTNRQAVLWLAPDLDYLAVKMEKRDKNDEIISLDIQALHALTSPD